MTSHAASTAVVVGEQMGRLVKSSAALLEGAIGFAHLGIMARTCAALSESDTAVRHFNEGRLLGLARAATVQDFRTICRHAIHGADRELFLAAQEEVRGWRTLTVTNGGDGMVEVAGMFDPEGGAILRTTLDPLARQVGPDDTRAREQRYADALIELCVRAMDRGDVPQRAGQRTHLQVTTTMETLLRLSGPAGELDGGALVAADTVQRMACDSTVTRVLVNAESAVIDVGRSQRVVRGATRRALNIRDKGCRWPGCSRSASWTAAHHIVHWSRGGASDLDNLVLLCRQHHWRVHEGGWSLVRCDDGSLLTHAPPVEHLFRSIAPGLVVYA